MVKWLASLNSFYLQIRHTNLPSQQTSKQLVSAGPLHNGKSILYTCEHIQGGRGIL